MAKRRPITQEVPEAVREAVDRTVQATIGSAQLTRGRAQEAVDELVRTAESRAGAVRERVVGAFESSRPASGEELQEVVTELRRISRRLAAIERRLDEGDGRLAGAATPRSRSGRADTGAKKPRSGAGGTGAKGEAKARSGGAAAGRGRKSASGGGRAGGGSRAA